MYLFVIQYFRINTIWQEKNKQQKFIPPASDDVFIKEYTSEADTDVQTQEGTSPILIDIQLAEKVIILFLKYLL